MTDTKVDCLHSHQVYQTSDDGLPSDESLALRGHILNQGTSVDVSINEIVSSRRGSTQHLMAALEPGHHKLLVARAKNARQDSFRRAEARILVGGESSGDGDEKASVKVPPPAQGDPLRSPGKNGEEKDGGSPAPDEEGASHPKQPPQGESGQNLGITGETLARYYNNIKGRFDNNGGKGHNGFHKFKDRAKIDQDEEDILSVDEKGGGAIDDYYQGNRQQQWLLSPQHQVAHAHTLVMFLTLVVFVFYLPVRIAFLSAERGVWVGIDMVFSFLFLVDIIINFNTGFIDPENGVVCYDRLRIASRYAHRWLLVDILAMFPFTLIEGLNPGAPANAYELVYLLSVPKIVQVYGLMNDVQMWNRMREWLFVAARTFFSVIMTTHVLGCGWYMLATLTHLECDDLDMEDDDIIQGECPWIYRYNYVDLSLGRRFLGSVYWSLTTLTTVGYGDISARTVEEQVYSMTVQIVGVSWYGYIVGSWATVLNGFDKQDKALRSKMTEIIAFTKDKELPPDLARSVRHHFRYMYHKEKWVNYDGEEIVGDLPPGLRAQVVCHTNRQTIEAIPWLRDKDETFIADLVVFLKTRRYKPKEILFKESQLPEELIFVISGKVDLLFNGQKVSMIRSGGMAALVGIMGGQEQKVTGRARGYVEAYAVRRDLFFKILGVYPMYFDGLLLETKKVVREIEKASPEARAFMERSPVLSELMLLPGKGAVQEGGSNDGLFTPPTDPFMDDSRAGGGLGASFPGSNYVGVDSPANSRVSTLVPALGTLAGSGPELGWGGGTLEEMVDRAVDKAVVRNLSSLELSIRESIDLSLQKVSPFQAPLPPGAPMGVPK